MSLNVIALGGNAILDKDPTDEGQKKIIALAARYIIDFVSKGEKVVLSHGNGPQVGNLLLQQKAANTDKNPALSLDSCVAMTQGSIGYWLQNALMNEMNERNMDKPIVSLITQTLVNEKDPSFSSPSKPIGPFYSKDELLKELQKNSFDYIEDSGRGYRKVVPSPLPQKIVEKDAIYSLVKNDILTICSGGGGIPVVLKDGKYMGVEAVCDKDFSAQVLAENIDADRLIILTGVDNIYINYNKPNQRALKNISVKEAEKYINNGQFAKGSMLPKIEAAVKFVQGRKGRQTIITSIENLPRVDQYEGTTIS